jgi:uncharacterized protein
MSSEHRVDVFALARAAGVLEGRLPLAQSERLRAGLRDAAGAIEYSFDGFFDSHGRVAARLHVRGDLPLMCDLCNKPVNLPVDQVASYFFVAMQAELDRLPVTVDGAEPLLGSATFDLLALVEDEAILALPVSPRHADCAAAARPARATHPPGGPFAGLAGLLGGRDEAA